MPSTLGPLKQWLTPTLPTDWTGITTSDCYIFLPSLLRLKKDNLPLVPPIVHHPEEELEYDSIIFPEEPWVSRENNYFYHITCDNQDNHKKSVPSHLSITEIIYTNSCLFVFDQSYDYVQCLI